MVTLSHYFVCVRETLPPNRAVERGERVQSTQARTPTGDSRCCQTQRGLVLAVTCFALALVFRSEKITHRHRD